jgi:hypothetical protein
LRFRGAWANSTGYLANDVFTANGNVYIVLMNLTTPATPIAFDPAANDGMGHDFYGLLLSDPANTLPSGGSAGQALVKIDGTDYNVTWAQSTVPVGGTTGQILAKASGGDYDVGWVDATNATFSISLKDLLDVTVDDSPTDAIGYNLQWDGSAWTAQPSAARGSTSFTNANSAYTPVVGDEFSFVLFTYAGTVTITVPTNNDQTFAIDSELTFCADNTGTVLQNVGDTGVTVDKPDGFLAKTQSKSAVVTIKKVAVNRWKLFGLLAPDV